MIDDSVLIEENVTIGENVTIKGNTIIKSGTIIGDNNIIENSVIEKNNIIGNDNKIGPFTHLRENNIIGNNNYLGSFVEISNSSIKDNNNIKHLTYVGNVKMGSNITVGAGVVFTNYHPKKKEKYETIVNDFASIGSNSTVVAPVVIGANSLIGAGSTVTIDIDRDSLYILRDKEVYKKDYYKGE